MKKYLTCFFLLAFSFTSLFSQINLEWIKVEDLPSPLQSQSCNSSTDNCGSNPTTICYALVFTPQVTGTLTSYNTFFRLDCAAGNSLTPVFNESCSMNDNSDIIQVCPAIEQRFNASGNSGNLSVTAGQQYLLHEVCFEVDTLISETIQIRTGAVQSSASITVGGNPNIVNLDVLDLVVDGSECIVLLPPPGPRAVVENGVPYFSDDRGFLLKGQDGNCYLIYIDGNGELIHEIRECPQ